MNGPAQTVISAEKFMGFERALRALRGQATGIVRDVATFEHAEAYEGTRRALADDRAITAIIGVETDMGLGALDACRDMGRACPAGGSSSSWNTSSGDRWG